MDTSQKGLYDLYISKKESYFHAILIVNNYNNNNLPVLIFRGDRMKERYRDLDTEDNQDLMDLFLYLSENESTMFTNTLLNFLHKNVEGNVIEKIISFSQKFVYDVIKNGNLKLWFKSCSSIISRGNLTINNNSDGSSYLNLCIDNINYFPIIINCSQQKYFVLKSGGDENENDNVSFVFVKSA